MKKSSNHNLRTAALLHCCVISLALLPAVVSAAEEGGQGSSPMDWVWRFVNFAILVIILAVFVTKPLKAFLQQRKELIEKAISEAREAKELAARALAEVEERLKVKDSELEEIISSARRSGEKEKDRLVEEGERLKEKILLQAKTNIDFDLKKAKEEIKAEAVQAAMDLAEEKIKGKLTKEDQERLLQESLKLLGGKN
ncbi:MAG: ATP synthase F0 subunit B [Thermodesulfovibrionales bacterium]